MITRRCIRPLIEEIPRGTPVQAGELFELKAVDPTCPALDVADRRPRDPGAVGDHLLGESEVFPDLAEPLAKLHALRLRAFRLLESVGHACPPALMVSTTAWAKLNT